MIVGQTPTVVIDTTDDCDDEDALPEPAPEPLPEPDVFEQRPEQQPNPEPPVIEQRPVIEERPVIVQQHEDLNAPLVTHGHGHIHIHDSLHAQDVRNGEYGDLRDRL